MNELDINSAALILTLVGVVIMIARNEQGKKTDNKLHDVIANQLNDLHQWHNVKDEEGMPVWYVRRSLGDAIQSLSENIKIVADVLRVISTAQNEIQRDIHDIKKAS